MSNETALIVGAGSGLSAALARLCATRGMSVALAARGTDKLGDLAAETGAETYACDASDPGDVAALFDAVGAAQGDPSLVIYNPSYRQRAPFVELDAEEVRKSLMITCYGGFLVGQAAAKRMLVAGGGSIQFTGASASVKGYKLSAPFAMGKFGLRGLAQSMARELAPENIHVAHFIIDGGIEKDGGHPRAQNAGEDGLLDPDAIAQTYLQIHDQHRSAWTWEVELRPWTENF
ncbi:MAG: SDR family NAD(P)-dependent oxidoreductase [Rhodospirillaceae bacterium]|nr:SDR family NAD(P)-dependent oxidoreductase [Rhodospirillaceae bacterium]MBT3908719.1 SDR family NAD(P)-dependent oxidoreductase [Rhodospirillaceae bacterium]MBT6608808.1 SDR family NAD(P)-dependent oxidoreductase [Rhodospirillaceae bacterium]